MPEQLAGETILWRRVQPNKLHYENGTYRPQSATFMPDSDGEICVHRADLADPESITTHHPADGIVRFQAHVVLALGYAVYADPLPDDPSHAVIKPPSGWGPKACRRAANQILEQLGDDSWVVRNFPAIS